MSDSSSFTSLIALVDSDSLQCNLSSSPSEDGRIPRGLSDNIATSTPKRVYMPLFSFSESPITNVPSEQLNNISKSKKLKKQNEIAQEKLHEEMRKIKIEEQNRVIDQAIQTEPQLQTQESISPCRSFDYLVLDYKKFVNRAFNLASSGSSLEPLSSSVDSISSAKSLESLSSSVNSNCTIKKQL